MSALTQPRMTLEDRFKTLPLPLAPGAKCWKGGMACIDTAAANVKPGTGGNANLVNVGDFFASFDNTAGTGTVQVLVRLDREIVVKWYDNATGANAVTAANLFAPVYVQDDHTVTTLATGNSAAGRVWAIDALKGVAIEALGL